MQQVRERIAGFVLNDLLFGDEARMPSDSDSLLGSGVIDSTGVLELIEFLESTFGVQVADDETVPENLDGIDRLTAYVARKQASSAR